MFLVSQSSFPWILHGGFTRLQQPPVATRAQQLQELTEATARWEVSSFQVKDLPKKRRCLTPLKKAGPGGEIGDVYSV